MTSKKKKELTILIVGLPAFFWYSFVLKNLWFWFMVPMGLPVISLMQAMGIDLLITFIVNPYTNIKDKTTHEIILPFLTRPAVFLLFGFIIKSFI